MKRQIIGLAAALALGGCSIFGGDGAKTTPTVGKRVPVLSPEVVIEADPELAALPIVLPAATANQDWAQPGGNAAKSMGHLALGASPQQLFQVVVGAGSTMRGRLAASPIVVAGKVYTIDIQSVVSARDANTGAELWRADIAPEDANSLVLFGGGVSYDNGRLYVTNGLGQVAALEADSGKVVWQVRLGGPLRGSPTIANDNVYVISQDNQIFALNPTDGSTRWHSSGAVEQAGVFGAAAPAAGQGTVVAGYSSGELVGYRYENGRPIWQDALTRTVISTSVGTLSDVDAEPVIDSGRVYALGQGGRLVAIELNTGQRIWEINIAGISTPWVVGDWIFVVTDQARLLAVSRGTGKVKWISQLKRYRDEDDKEGPLTWYGPVLAGERLILANSWGEIAYVSPYDGSVQTMFDSGMEIATSPVVANNTLYILHETGTLTAWR